MAWCWYDPLLRLLIIIFVLLNEYMIFKLGYFYNWSGLLFCLSFISSFLDAQYFFDFVDEFSDKEVSVTFNIFWVIEGLELQGT